MALILMIAAGILLAFLLLPLLGPIVMIALSVGVVALLVYCAVMSIGAGLAAVELMKDLSKQVKSAQEHSFRRKIRAAPEYQLALADVEELLTLTGLRRSPAGLWYRYIFQERLKNCSCTGIFRVEDNLNRLHLNRYLEKARTQGGGSPESMARIDGLCQEILACHDQLCQQKPRKQQNI